MLVYDLVTMFTKKLFITSALSLLKVIPGGAAGAGMKILLA